MTERKHYNMTECSARRWFSRAEWRRRGVVIAKDAKRVGTCWNGIGAFDVFTEDQGDRIKLTSRERALMLAIKQIAQGDLQGLGPPNEAHLEPQKIARAVLKVWH